MGGGMGKRGSTRRRDALKRKLSYSEDVCWLCLEPLDLEVPTPHPDSVEIDEEIPFSLGGSSLDSSNCHLVHRRCNLRKGAKILPRGALARTPRQGPPSTSRDW